MRVAPSMKPQEVANSIWGLATLGWQAEEEAMRGARPHDSDRPVPVCGVRAFPVGPGREERGEPRMRLPKQRGGLPLLLSGPRQPGAWLQTPRRPHDSDRPVPVCGVRAFPIGPGREERGEPRMRLPKQRGGLPLLLRGSRHCIITPNYGGFKKRTGLNFGGYTVTESNSTSRIKLRVR